MSFIHVLGTIGKDVLKVGTVISKGIPGPLGFAISTGLSIANQEVNGGSGPDKKVAVMNEVLPLAPEGAPNKIQAIEKILEGLVAVANGLGELFPSPPPK